MIYLNCTMMHGLTNLIFLRMCSWLYLYHFYIPLVWCLGTEPLLVYCFESIVIYVISLPRYLFVKLEY